MKIIATIARVLLGCVFIFFGLNFFLQFLHMPPPPSGPAGDFAKALFVSHYFYAVGVFVHRFKQTLPKLFDTAREPTHWRYEKNG